MHYCTRCRGRSHLNVASAETNVGQLSESPNFAVLSEKFNVALTFVARIVPLFTSGLVLGVSPLNRKVAGLLRRGTRWRRGLYHVLIVFSVCRKFEMTVVTHCKLGWAEDQGARIVGSAHVGARKVSWFSTNVAITLDAFSNATWVP